MDRLSLNLSGLCPALRIAAWERLIPPAFPGLRISQVEGAAFEGFVKSITIGPVRIWSIQTTAHTVAAEKSLLSEDDALIAILIVKEGVLKLVQDHSQATLYSGDMAILQNNANFEITSLADAQVLICTLPQMLAFGRQINLFKLSGATLPHEAPLCSLLRVNVEEALDKSDRYSELDCSAWLAAFMALTAGLRSEPSTEALARHWRVDAAIQMIEDAIDSPELDAEAISRHQNISRRRLDQLFVRETGLTLASQILEARLLHAASALGDKTQQTRHITDIAFDVGFKDTAHFSRAFKRRFDASPSEWRRKALSKWPATDSKQTAPA